MNPLDVKALKKLADACRKSGIKSFKGYGFEFTLSDEAPVSEYKRSKSSKKLNPINTNTSTESIPVDTLSEEELLFWSTGGVALEDKSE